MSRSFSSIYEMNICNVRMHGPLKFEQHFDVKKDNTPVLHRLAGRLVDTLSIPREMWISSSFYDTEEYKKENV